MPFVFTIQNMPTAGDTVTVDLTDGDAVSASYDYEVQQGDSLINISDALKTEINAGVLFTAIDQTTYAGQVGLEISQVTTNNYGDFTGEVTITYGENSIVAAYTMVFDEANNAFEGERSYQPENWTCLGVLLVSFKDGDLYTHDDQEI